MSAENEELIDYEDEHETTNGVTAAPATAAAGDDKEKKGYVGIHSTGFRSAISSLKMLHLGSSKWAYFILNRQTRSPLR